jgi:integrase
MSESRVKVWIQRFKDRPNLVLQWIDPDTGARRSESSKTSDPDKAEQKRADKEYELNHGLHRERSKLTWEQFRELYETEELAGLSHGTQEKASAVFNIFERIVTLNRLDRITERTVSKYVARLREMKRSVATINSNLRHIKRALNWAVEQKLLTSRPKIRKLKERKKLPRKITAEAFDRILAKAPDDQWRSFLLTAWYTGLRLGELVALTWGDVDLPGHRILVQAETAKGGRDEWIPLHPSLELALRGLDPSTSRVFELGLTKEQVSRHVKWLAEEAGVRCTTHDLRRSFCSRLAAEGVSLQIAQRLMRHASPETTAKYYTNVEDVLHEAVARV